MYAKAENDAIKVENFDGKIVVSTTFDERVAEGDMCFDSCCYTKDELDALFRNEMHESSVSADALFDLWMIAGFINAAIALKALLAEVA